MTVQMVNREDQDKVINIMDVVRIRLEAVGTDFDMKTWWILEQSAGGKTEYNHFYWDLVLLYTPYILPEGKGVGGFVLPSTQGARELRLIK